MTDQLTAVDYDLWMRYGVRAIYTGLNVPLQEDMTAELKPISDDEWSSEFSNRYEVDYKDAHEYYRGKFYDIDVIYCIKCGANELFDKKFYVSCEEKKMHDALK